MFGVFRVGVAVEYALANAGETRAGDEGPVRAEDCATGMVRVGDELTAEERTKVAGFATEAGVDRSGD